MKVRALIDFEDLKAGKTRYIGDIFGVSKERYEEILEKGGAWVEIVEDEKKETAKKETKKKGE